MIFTRLIYLVVGLSVPGYCAAASVEPFAFESKWIYNEQRIARSALEGLNIDLLVLPVQGGANSFDPIERSLVTRIVVDRLRQNTDKTIPDPTLMLRFLGTYRSVYPKTEISRIAMHVNAREIVEMHADHNRGGQFSFDVTILGSDHTTVKRTKSWTKLGYSDSQPPFVAIQGILSELVDFISDGTAGKEVVGAVKSKNLARFRFPSSIDELKSESKKSPLHSAAYLQLIGMLHPSGLFNEVRDHLFERSLVELSKVPDSMSSKTYFTARALGQLGRRPAAMKILDDPQTSHERALLAAMNGDLPSLRDEVEQMGTSPLDLMAWRDLLFVEKEYRARVERATTERFVEEHPAWAPFIYRALRDTSRWANYSAATMKVGLEQLLPSETPSLQNLMATAEATGEFPDDLEFTRQVWRHIESINAATSTGPAGQPEKYQGASELDILDLAKTVTIANQLRRVDDDLETRVLPKSALKKIAEFESFFAGHPAVTLQKGRALEALAKDSTGVERANLLRESSAAFLEGLSRTGQMTEDAVYAAQNYNRFLIGSLATSVRGGVNTDVLAELPIRFFEWPRSNGWYQVVPGDDLAAGIFQECIEYTWTTFNCLKFRIEILEKDADQETDVRQELLASNAHRFIGNPERAEFSVRMSRDRNNPESQISELRLQIDAGNHGSSMYNALGRTLKRLGDYRAAQEALLSYPVLLNPARAAALENDNFAYNAGSMFYWIGQHELAVPLLNFSAMSGTGSSGGSMSAGYRLALIRGDFESAEQWAVSRVQRYTDKFAIRDLLQILHLRGKSESAWSVFENVQSSTQDTEMWAGAFVGHRLAAATTDDILNWLVKSESRKEALMRVGSTNPRLKLAPRYLLIAGTMDRLPGPELSSAIAEFRFDRPPTYIRITRWDRSGPEPVPIPVGYVREDGHSVQRDGSIPSPPDVVRDIANQEVESRFEMLATAMSAFLSNDLENAFRLFDETAHYYLLDEYLPYYTFSAADQGITDHIGAALEAREPAFEETRKADEFKSSEFGYRFDEDLTYAVLASFDGRHEAAIARLNQAFNNRPYIRERTIFPYFQVVDLADRLFDRTGVELYREYVLDLARRHTVILPMYSWAYFVVAKHSNSDSERLKAAMIGLKLDPLSHRATRLPADLIRRAKDQLAGHGDPFLSESQESSIRGT